jgi:uncharacterized protein YidB (DUF937 family)
MGFLDNAVNKSVPQGSSLAKPLLLAFGALLASGALTGAFTRKQAPTPAPGTSPAADPQAGGLLGGLGGLLEKFQQSGHADVAKSWVGSGPNQPISPGQLSSALGPSLIKTLAEKTGMSEQDVTAHSDVRKSAKKERSYEEPKQAHTVECGARNLRAARCGAKH